MRAHGVRTTSPGTTRPTTTVAWAALRRNKFTGTFRGVAREKQRALDAIYGRDPERFVKGRPLVELPPSMVAINPVPLVLVGAIDDRVNFRTLPLLREAAKDCYFLKECPVEGACAEFCV